LNQSAPPDLTNPSIEDHSLLPLTLKQPVPRLTDRPGTPPDLQWGLLSTSSSLESELHSASGSRLGFTAHRNAHAVMPDDMSMIPYNGGNLDVVL
jgi:hypothetical protein